jgi:esterase/lipase superfamily enzyme
VTVSTGHLDQQAFTAAVTAIARETSRNRVMIFVHGFNNRFDDAAYRLAQIVQDSRAPVIPVLFSWPSRGVATLAAYQADRENADLSRDALDQLIGTIALGAGVRDITILCHSMGCQPTIDALQSRSMRTGRIGGKVKNILLVAPDVDASVFRRQMHQMGASRPGFALFLSQDDRALELSKSLWGGDTRLGEVNPELEPYKSDFEREKIMVFDLSHLDGKAHSRAFDEVTSVVGMIERRLAAGQQLTEERAAAVDAGNSM